MNKSFAVIFSILLSAGIAYSQTTPDATTQNTAASQPHQRPKIGFDLAEYGVEFQTDPRLIVMMAALEAAGLDLTSPGRPPSVFRAQVRKDLADLNPDLRNRLRVFYERNKLPAPATPADQAARYVSLALALGPPPTFDAPERSDDLPGGLLEVLDFAPLLREFYRGSGIDERMVSYTRAYQAEGDRLRPPAAELIRAVLTYLHTRPITISAERVPVKTPSSGNKNQPPIPIDCASTNADFLSFRICCQRPAQFTSASSVTSITRSCLREQNQLPPSCAEHTCNMSSIP